MKQLTIGVFHDENIGRELGKKGTESDILMFNRKTDESICTFMYPVEDKITPKSQIISSLDVAIVVCEEISPSIGETILLLDAVGISQGMIITTPYTDTTRLTSMIKGTSLESFILLERNIPEILKNLENIKTKRNITSPPVVVVDHSFSVKGVGEIILGFVKQGVIRKHDKVILLPAGKEVIVRSIQMQDKNYDEASAGDRVGLAIRGATVDEMRRGSILSSGESAKIDSKFVLSFNKNSFYPEIKKGIAHATVGMQTIPVNITELQNDLITIESEKPISYTSNDIFLLLDLNAKKLHLIGKGIITDN